MSVTIGWGWVLLAEFFWPSPGFERGKQDAQF
jgi:hypothetical protein